METKKRYRPRKDFVGIYKPRKNIKGGAAAQFKMGGQRECMFFEIAPQVNPKEHSAPYDWKNKGINIKLGENDIGMLLALFNGTWPLNDNPKSPDLEIFHKFGSSTKVIKIKKQQNRYYMNVSHKEGGELNSVSIPIEIQEVELIKIALAKGYSIMLGW